MVDTVLDLITEALLDLGVLAEGEPPSSPQANGALSKLNSMLDSWNTQKLTVYGSTPTVVPIVAGQLSYTMGPSGNINTDRPITIQAAYLRNPNTGPQQTMDIPLQILTDEEYQNYPYKLSTTNIPFAVWINYTAPIATVTLVPGGTDTNYSLVLWQQGRFASLTLNQQFLLPPGYREPIVANLVLRLSPGYSIPPSGITSQIAIAGKRNLQTVNLQVNALNVDPLLTRGYFDPKYGWWH
jgi:hypothetical protein